VTPKNKIIAFKQSNGPSPSDIIESGEIGDLNYAIYKRGVIHIFDKKNERLFKKDPDVFEQEITKLKLNELTEGQTVSIQGSGDNDDLVFKCLKGDIVISLEKKEYGMVNKLKQLISKAKVRKNN